jgi:hypothetical protein
MNGFGAAAFEVSKVSPEAASTHSPPDFRTHARDRVGHPRTNRIARQLRKRRLMNGRSITK